MINPYRAMCAELLAIIPVSGTGNPHSLVVARARALLGQPEPQSLPANYIDPEHTGQDREVLEIFYTACQSEGGTADEIHLRGIRAVLAARALLDQPVAEGLTDEELLRVAATAIAPYEISGITPGEYEPETECCVEAYGSELIAYARAVLARWGRPTSQPVPVSERLPGSEDCLARPTEESDAGWCWTFSSAFEAWAFQPVIFPRPHPEPPRVTLEASITHWLPANALPHPEATNA